MKLQTENYKGVAIQSVERILGNKRYVEASAKLAGKVIKEKGNTKAVAVQKVKRILGKML